ncbi:thymic stromal cotransporter homolog [Chanos chanos]|uniref:Thymic stromal cotransporter homolog n=1 Tax=Chanos chanos TaxID=29144 RepID=A0A6J2W8C6_CHACN|nr:thymic stromal cotransporter homolog [Chanos chanos]
MCAVLSLVEPVVIVHKVGNSFFQLALTLTVYNHSLLEADGQPNQAQAVSSHFLLIHSVLSVLLGTLAIIPLGRMADRRGPKVLLVVPQVGSVLGMCFLLFFLLWELPLWFLYFGAVVYGLSGGSPAYWAGVVSMAALSSKPGHRTLKLNVVDFCGGVAGVLGGLLAGYVYGGKSGVILVLTAILLIVLGLLYSTLLLSFPISPVTEGSQPLAQPQGDWNMNTREVVLLVGSMVLFMLGMEGAENVLSLYVLKPPLAWDSVWAGYGQAATNAMYLTSFLGVLVLSGPLGDQSLCLLGIISNCTGMALMAFATHSWVYFMARAVMLFACVPMPTLRAMLSKVLDAQQYGRVFGLLQLVLAVTEVLSTVIFTSVYPLTLDWHGGLCFLLSCFISYLSVIPILYLSYRGRRQDYTAI